MKLTLDISDTKIASLLFSANISYWARIDSNTLAKYDGYAPGAADRYSLAPRGLLVLTERNEGTLNLRYGGRRGSDTVRGTVSYGLRIMAERYPRHFGNFLSGQADGETGDVFVQCCVFGEAKYG